MEFVRKVKDKEIPGYGPTIRQKEIRLLEHIGSIKKGHAAQIKLDNYSQRERVKTLCKHYYPDTEFVYPTRKDKDGHYYCYVALKETTKEENNED